MKSRGCFQLPFIPQQLAAAFAAATGAATDAAAAATAAVLLLCYYSCVCCCAASVLCSAVPLCCAAAVPLQLLLLCCAAGLAVVTCWFTTTPSAMSNAIDYRATSQCRKTQVNRYIHAPRARVHVCDGTSNNWSFMLHIAATGRVTDS